MPEIKYDRLCEQLERMIRDGAFGNRLPGIHTLAKQLGANHITVRKALELLIDRGLLEVIPSRGTFVREPEKAVRNSHVIGCIGVCCSSHVREMVFNRQNELMRESGYKMLDSSASSKIFQENPRLLLQFPVDGYIFCGSSLSREMMQLLMDNGIPLIATINSNFPEINQVGMDHFAGYAAALKILKQRGCRRIAFLGYQRQDDFQIYIDDIRSVFRQEFGTAFDPGLFSVYCSEDYFLRHGEDYHKVIAEECIRSWGNNPPDGLVCHFYTAPTVRQLMPEVETVVFTSCGDRPEGDIVMYEDLPAILSAASGRMIEILSGDASITEIRIPFVIREKERTESK